MHASKTSALLALLTCLSICAPMIGRAQPIVLTQVRLIDGSGAPPVEHATLLIDDGRIIAAGRRVTVPRGADIRALPGCTVIPGLISDHSHVGLVAGTQTGAQNYTRENIVAQLQQYQRYGVTTVMALGLNGPLLQTLRPEAHAGSLGGADLFGVDHGIGVPDGGPPQSMIKVSDDQLYRPHDAQEAREAVRNMAANKTDLVKLWLDDFGGTVPAKMQPAVYQAVIDEAHKLGLRVAAHIHDLADAQAVVEAGVDILAHGVRDQDVPPQFIDLLKQRDVWYIATLALDDATFAWADQAPWTRTPFARAALSPDLAAQIDDFAWRSTTEAAKGTTAARRSLEFNLHNLKRLYDAGVHIGFGTDSGAAALRVPGIAEHRELALTVQAGLTPLQALTLATGNAAALLKLADRGTLRRGQRADFVVLKGDPTRNIEAADDIVEVWQTGHRVPH